VVRLAQALADAGLDLKWATDLKPEKYLSAERAQVLQRAGRWPARWGWSRPTRACSG
jgi:hypothetical protein